MERATFSFNTNVLYRNTSRLDVLSNACRENMSGNGSRDFQALLLTDTHGENLSVSNAVKLVNGISTLDCLIYLGDLCSSSFSKGQAETFMNTIIKSSKKPWLVVIGNHDVGNSMYLNYSCTHTEAYEIYTRPMIESGILKTGEYREGCPWYYHDFKARKVRVLCLYEYQAPLDIAENLYWSEVPYNPSYPSMVVGRNYVYGSTPVYCNLRGHSFRLKKSVYTRGGQYDEHYTMPYYRVGRADRVIMEDQARWIIETLKSTPANYGVLVATHNPAMIHGASISSSFSVPKSYTGQEQGQYAMMTDLLPEIVDAYNRRSNLDLRVVMCKSGWRRSDASYLNGESGYCYRLQADFKNRPDSYFAGYIGGHTHKDLVFKHPNYPGQYSVNPVCGITEYKNNVGSDVARPYNRDDQSYDALTAISVNRGRIALSRLGNTRTIHGGVRDFEIINYGTET